jgi:hypothetical protein
MTLHSTVPCAENYDLLTYRCANCRGVLNMVEPRASFRASASDRRIVPRYRVATTGTIKVNGGTISCLVRDMSAAGVGLDLMGRAGTPNHFTLSALGSQLPCQVIWRRETWIGIAFVKRTDPTGFATKKRPARN